MVNLSLICQESQFQKWQWHDPQARNWSETTGSRKLTFFDNCSLDSLEYSDEMRAFSWCLWSYLQWGTSYCWVTINRTEKLLWSTEIHIWIHHDSSIFLLCTCSSINLLCLKNSQSSFSIRCLVFKVWKLADNEKNMNFHKSKKLKFEDDKVLFSILLHFC